MNRSLTRSLSRPKKQLPGAFLALVVIFSLLLSGCGLDTTLANLLAQLTETPMVVTPPPTVTLPPQRTPTPAPETSGPLVITVWVPPQFDPGGTSASSSLFQAQLDAFATQNPEILLQVRVKALTGPGSIMETLTAATAAAPQAIPSLVALPRSDLETAALKGLIYPIDSETDLLDDPDWYPYARQLALVQESAFGIPFGGDSPLLVYRPERVGITPDDWYSVLSLGRPVIFQASDPQSLFTLALYQSAGGAVQNAQRRPVLQSEVLAEVLTLYSDGARQGSFPPWLTQYQTDEQAWQAYNEQRGNLLVTWSSSYLGTLPADSTAIPLPSLGDQNHAMASGWVWAVSDPDPDRRAIALRLAEHLAEPEYMAEWTAASGYLPTRPSALEAWTNQSLRNLVESMVELIQVRPPNDIIASLGTVLQDATLAVVKDQVDPQEAAETAAGQLQIQ